MDTSKQVIYDYLNSKYKRATLGKKEMAVELGVSLSTIDLYISKNMGIPRYRKLGKSKNAKVVFNIADVADFLSRTVETM